jgi:hypothetical protein
VDDYFVSVGTPVAAPAPTPAPAWSPAPSVATPDPWAQPAPGAAPAWPAYPTAYPGAVPQPGTSTATKVLIGLAIALGSLVVLGILTAIAIPVYLHQRDKAEAARTVVSVPDTLVGYPRMSGDIATQIEQQLKAAPGPGDHLVAVYGTTLPVVAVSVTKQAMTPADQRAFLRGVESTSDVPLSERDPGAYGGTLTCGTERSATLCVFADSGAYGAVMVFDSDDPMTTVREARAAIEHRR